MPLTTGHSAFATAARDRPYSYCMAASMYDERGFTRAGEMRLTVEQSGTARGRERLILLRNKENKMAINAPKDGAPGTTEQSPRWEGPEENRPRGYLPAKDDPEVDRDAVGENLRDPRKRDVSDGMKTRDRK